MPEPEAPTDAPVNAVESDARGVHRGRSRGERVASGWRALLHLVLFQVKTAHAGSVLGLAWTVLQPLLFLATYFFLITVLRAQNAHSGETVVQLLVILSGLVPWFFFARTVSHALTSLSSHAQFFKQINFPIEVLPFVSVGVAMVDFAVGLGLLLVLMIAAGTVGVSVVVIVPAVALMSLFLAAIASLLGPLAVMLPDLRRVVPPLLRVGLFMTPVLYLAALVPEQLKVFTYVNPLAYFISLFRYAALESEEVFVLSLKEDLLVATSVTLVVAGCAYVKRAHVRRTVVDYL